MHELLTNMVHKRCVSNDAALFLLVYYYIVSALNNSDHLREQLVFLCVLTYMYSLWTFYFINLFLGYRFIHYIQV